ncbi:hypothetical protein pdam_00023763, partial [Pocillopora damicornis]
TFKNFSNLQKCAPQGLIILINFTSNQIEDKLVVSDWNNLPKHIVEAGTLELFKLRLKIFLKLGVVI